MDAREIKVCRNKPKSIFFKSSHDDREPWHEVDLRKRGCTESLNSIVQTKLYSEPRAIAFPKHQDLLSLLHLVPPCFYDFYKTLKCAGKQKRTEEDIDGLPQKHDFDIDAE